MVMEKFMKKFNSVGGNQTNTNYPGVTNQTSSSGYGKRKVINSPHANISSSNVHASSLSSVTNGATFGGISSTFGVALDEVIYRDQTEVPRIVTQLCNFILKFGGLEAEGIFRVNGNARLVENLRASVDDSGVNGVDRGVASIDADLERCGDVYSGASLLKLYLRELPGGLVPAHITSRFIKVINALIFCTLSRYALDEHQIS
ncbi:unnamed protein product [Protopolystoma xenopodis]|uniref:Rho-GAP domain-containing protein n=1 Tax=Protopolystoma xenopodis TaxID=117903 RepID=A0A3S5ASC9_9PLAT|nr:unnamed protein product [Protopolystoma xenopodis]